jgi:predicted nucleic acid-binding protein
VAYYTLEAQTGEAAEIVKAAEVPMVNDLAVAEFNVAIHRKRRDGYLTSEEATAVLDLFDLHLEENVVRVAIEPRHAEATRALAAQLPGGLSLRTLDALHLAIAVDVGSTLATFDGRLAEAARAFGTAVEPELSEKT